MKKRNQIFSLFSIFLMVLLLSACSGGGSSATSGPKEIELTWENISDYLRIEYSFSPSKVTPKYGYKTMDVTINVFPVAEGSFDHVEIIPIITLKPGGGRGNNWQVIDDDLSYKYIKDLDDEYKGYLISHIALPVDGKCTETHTITQLVGLPDNLPDNGVYEFTENTATVYRLWASAELPEGTPEITGKVILP